MRAFFLCALAVGLASCTTVTAPDGTKTTTPPSPETLAAYQKLANSAAMDGLTVAAAVKELQSVPTKQPVIK